MSLFKENTLVIIDEEGEIIYLPKMEGEKDHHEAYLRLDKLIPGILEGFESVLSTSQGFELANHVAAMGKVVIWPSNITDIETSPVIVTLPKPLCDKTGVSLLKILATLTGCELYANTSRFCRNKNANYITEEFSGIGEFADCYSRIAQYVDASKMINSLSQTTEEDIHKTR